MQTPYELILGWRYTRAGKRASRNSFISFISLISMLGIALGVAPTTPAQFGEFLAGERRQWSDAVRAAQIRIE